MSPQPRKPGLALGLVACAALLACSSATHLLGSAPGKVSGRVTLGEGLVPPAEPQPVIVYLERDGPYAPPRQPRTARITQKQGRLAPTFLAIASGQSVRFENADTLVHNVFSYSTPNDFDLGLYGPGETRTVEIRYPGVVRLYCAMHPEMSGTIFVSPSRHYAVISRSGDFELTGVPPGSYRIRTWSPQLPRAWKRITLSSGESVRAELRIDKPDRSP